jgi:CDP-6-deoxy-D-xylo-4-hexulose-3-dehydrase
MMFWPLQENIVTDSDIESLVTFIKNTKRFTQFKKVRQFEKDFSDWQGCKHSVFVNSGSSANLILINAAKEHYQWKDGDEVIVPTVTWATTVTPVMQSGLSPIFVDINLTDLSVDYEKVRASITSKTRAIFIAHLLGFPADIIKLKEIIGNRDIIILEDCCESQGAFIGETKVGNHGVGGTFSFYWGHHMTTVEGGMVCTNDDEIYKLLLLKRSHGLARELPTECHKDIANKYKDIDFAFLFLTDGFNVRNTEFSAVLGIDQLKRMNEYIEIRNNNYKLFLQLCMKYKEHLILLDSPGKSSFVLPFLFKNKIIKDRFQQAVGNAGIESRPLISGNLLRQPFLEKYYNSSDYHNSDFIHENAFYIGNNQFVDETRLDVLGTIMEKFFSEL